MACVEFVNLCYTAGDTVNIDFQYLEDDGTTPIDLTGATAEMQLLEDITDLTSIPITGGITDPVNGVGAFSLSKVESQALLPILEGTPASIAYISKLRFEFSDATTRSVAGANITFEQSGIR
tara:strand:+ start:86 stop:451 length:366 start_codon:yes stop_codon:yes gene_type:complete